MNAKDIKYLGKRHRRNEENYVYNGINNHAKEGDRGCCFTTTRLTPEYLCGTSEYLIF